MNSVSWFIYIAHVSNNLGILLFLFGLFVATSCLMYTIYQALENDRFQTKFRYVVLAVSLLGVSCLMPDKNTLYAIAASQVGEKIIQSEQVSGTADEASKAIRQWIKKQIEPQQPKDK